MRRTQHDTGTNRLLILALIGLLLAAFMPRFLIADRAIVFDERFTLMYTESVSEALEHCHEDVHPPLYFVLVAIWRKVLPSTEFSLRFLSLIFGMFSVVGIFMAARSLAGFRTGLAAMLITALSPYHWLYSTELRPYAFFLAFSAFSTWAFISLLKKGDLGYFVALAIATTLNLYTHYFALFLLLVQGIVFLAVTVRRSVSGQWTSSFRNKQILYGLLAVALIVIAYAPWIRVLRGIVTQSVFENSVVGVGKRVGRGVTLKLVGSTFYRPMGWGVIPFFIHLALIIWGLLIKRIREASFLFIATWVIPFLMLAVWKPAHFIAPKYFIFTYPITVTLVACGIGAAAKFLAGRGLRRGVAAVTLAILVSASPLLPGQHPPYIYHHADWKDIVEDLREYMKEGDRICIPNDSKSYALVGHYAPEGFFREHRLVTWREKDMEKRFEPFETGTDVWVLRMGALPEALSAGIGEGLKSVKTWDIYPVSVSLHHWVPGRVPIRSVVGDSGRIDAMGAQRPPSNTQVKGYGETES